MLPCLNQCNSAIMEDKRRWDDFIIRLHLNADESDGRDVHWLNWEMYVLACFLVALTNTDYNVLFFFYGYFSFVLFLF